MVGDNRDVAKATGGGGYLTWAFMSFQGGYQNKYMIDKDCVARKVDSVLVLLFCKSQTHSQLVPRLISPGLVVDQSHRRGVASWQWYAIQCRISWSTLLSNLKRNLNWIYNHLPSKVYHNTYPFPNLNGCTVEVWEWLDNFKSHFMLHVIPHPWWRHQMETSSALLALCTGNSPVTGEFPAQRPVTRSFDVFFDLRLNKRLSKRSWGWWFETPSRSLWRP